MASLDEEPDIGIHEGHGHGDIPSVREDSVLGGTLLLDAGNESAFVIWIKS